MAIRLELLDASARAPFPVVVPLRTDVQHIVLIDDAAANTLMVAERSYTFHANPPDPTLLYWAITIFQPASSAASRRGFIRQMCLELIARGAGDVPVRWYFPPSMLATRTAVKNLLQPRVIPNGGFELTPNEGLARLP